MSKEEMLNLLAEVKQHITRSNHDRVDLKGEIYKLNFMRNMLKRNEITSITQLVSYILYTSMVDLNKEVQ